MINKQHKAPKLPHEMYVHPVLLNSIRQYRGHGRGTRIGDCTNMGRILTHLRVSDIDGHFLGSGNGWGVGGYNSGSG